MAASVCGRCGTLVERAARRCPQCDRLWPALLGLRPALDRFFSRDRSFSRILAPVLIVVFLLSALVAQKSGDLVGEGFWRFMVTPGDRTMVRFGALHPFVPQFEHWYRLLTACFPHFGIIHLLFNVSALLQIGPLVEAIYGNARFTILFVACGIVGFLVGLPFVAYTAGASGAICGLVGVLVGYGYQRGGTFGEQARQMGIRWLIYIAIFGLIFTFINNWAHGGGAVAGYLLGRVFCPYESSRRYESDSARIVALLCILLVLVTAGFAVYWGLRI